MRVPFAILTLLLIPGFAAGGDGTPPKARQSSQDKDKQGKPPAKVYTDEDLKKAHDDPDARVTVLGSSEPQAEPESPAPPEGQPAAATETPSDRQLDEATWKMMAKQAWGEVRAAEARIRDLEAQIQDLLVDRNPNPPDLLDPSRLQKREAAKAEAQKQLDETRARLATAQEALEKLQTRARNAGAPQSWVEEPQPEPEPQG